MSSLFIAGNGFDIAHGIPSTYGDFRSFVLGLYPNALQYRDEIVYLEDYDNITADEFAAEILLNAMDKAAGKNWCNFEDALACINFNNKFPEANHRENETDAEDRDLMKYYLLYMDMLTSGFIKASELWQEFFRVWIKSIQGQIDKGSFAPKDNLRDLFLSPDMRFLTFNYTKTLQKLYGVRKVIHIHNRVGQKLIFGHGEDDVFYNRLNNIDLSDGPYIGSSFLDDMIMSFRKDTISPLKKYNDFFKKLDAGIDRVYSYGFGYGKVDSVYIKEIIKRISPNAVWCFTAYEAKNSEALRVKKVKLRRYGFKGGFDFFDG